MNRGFTLIELLVAIMIIVVCSILLLVAISDFPENAEYEIAHDGNTYWIESYTKEHNGECIYIADKELRICGDYTIRKLNQE